MQADIGQLREFLGLYNQLTERCFRHCVAEFPGVRLDGDERRCLDRCIQKVSAILCRRWISFEGRLRENV